MNLKKEVPLFSAVAANSGIDLLTPTKRVIDSYWYVLGTEVSKFEEEFAAYVQVEHCVSVANGTDALEFALRGANIGSGDVVVAVANAGFYGSTAIHSVGATPFYVDVSADTLTLSLECFAAALSHRPKAVIVTHLYGQLANIEAIVKLAHDAGVVVVEDCAQSHGAQSNGRQAGSFGDVACFSFYPTKNLGALGDGGAVVTNNKEIAGRIRSLRQYGWSSKYNVSIPGGRNSRLDEMQAAILREKLPHLSRWNEQRRSIAIQYSRAFASLPIECPQSLDETYVAHLYVIRLSNREGLRTHLKVQQIASDVHYPVPDHKQAAYLTAEPPHLPITEASSNQILTLPCFPGLETQDVDRVIASVTTFCRS